MTQLSTETHRARRFAVLCFFVFTALFVAAAAKPWVNAQAGWRVDLKEGETAASSLSINNRCKTPHNFRVESKFKSLRFDEPTDSIRIEQGATRTIPAVFNAHGLKEKVYRGNVAVECLDCKEEAGCNQDRDELAVEMNVVKAVTSVAKGNATTASNPQLILNKHHEPNQTSTSWNIGVPITYVIEVRNSGGPNSNITVSDALPPGFVVVSTTCTANSGATCPGPNLPPPPFALFHIPTGGLVEIRMTGYFTTGGPKINTATATAKDTQGNVLDVGSSNSSIDQLQVPFTASPVNISVIKSASPTTSTLPAQVHYSVTVKNLTTTDVYLGGHFRLRDVFSISPFVGLNWTVPVSSIVCTPSGGAVCPDMPASVAPNAGQIFFPYDASGGPTANDSGWMPGLGSYRIDFDVDITKNATCGPSQVSFRNQAGLDSLSSFSDSNPGDNWSTIVSTALTTGLTACDTPTAGLELNKIQCTTTTGPCISGTNANWNAPVRYRITIKNPTTAALSNVLLSDSIYKLIGTPTFTATLNPNEPHCVSGCTTLTPGTAIPPPTVNIDSTPTALWTATLPNLAPSQTAEIDYIVVYAPICETDKGANHIRNRINAGGLNRDVDTTFLEADPCGLTAEKTKVTPGPIVFEQQVTYNVVFSNPSSATLDVGTIRDVLSNTSNSYGTFKIDSTATCSLNSGTVSLPTGHQPFPFQVNLSGVTVNYSSVGWQGAFLLNERMTFGPNSSVQCQIKVTAHKPADSNPFCQGAGNPQLRNAVYMDLSTNYSPASEPSIYDVEVADLPLCRSVIVTKVAQNHNYGPGAPVTYTITAENKGQNTVNNFVLLDMVPLALFPASAGPCSAPCTAGPTLNNTTGQLNVSYGPLAPNTPVSFVLNATAPQAGGPIGNTAVGSFLPGGNFYFQGDEINFLRQEENIQVLTPVLSKQFDPVVVGPNGTSTLTFNITNTNSDPKQTGINFTDTFAAGLQITNVISNGCGGTVTPSTDGHTITLTGGQLVGPNADGSGKHSCQISVQVKASGECGVFENKRANFSQVKNLDVSNVDAHLEVTGCPPKDSPKLEKEFKPANIGLGGTTTLAFTITNSTGDPKQTGIAFSDTLPAGLQIVSVVSNGCSGVVSVSSDGRTVTLAGGQLIGSNADGSGKHSCTIMVKVKVVGECGVYRNSKENFSEVKNLDISGAQAQLQVDCGPSSGLIVQKNVEGAPPGFSGQFNFLVQCATPNGFYQKAVTVNWPTPGFTVLNDVPAGSQCIVTEGPPPASLPANYAWAGLPSYLPQGGIVTVGPRGGKVTVTDTLSLCNESGQVTITKVVKGLPKDFIGVFEGTLHCWVGDKLQTFPVTLTSPNGLTTTIGDIPLGSTCTFQETGQPPLTGDFKWDQPVYSPLFGTVTLRGECCQQITVTNEARHCCTPAKGSNYEPVPNNSSSLPRLNLADSAKPAIGAPARRKQVPRQKQN